MGNRSAVFHLEADVTALAGLRIAVIGYGNLGRPVAQNLRDSQLPVIVGDIPGSHRDAAVSDGFDVRDVDAAVAAADIVFVLVPDEVAPDCFQQSIAAHLRVGAALCFASGYTLAYGLIVPPDNVDVLMIAPRMAGDGVRNSYLDGTGYLSYVSVEQDASGDAQRRMLALADAMGSLARGVLELSAAQEALLDLFVEQTFGACLGVALQLAFQLGVEAGIPGEAMVSELYMSGEMAHTFTDFGAKGFFRAVTQHGLTATYGGYLRVQELDAEALRSLFAAVLEDIRDGGFMRSLQREQADGYPTMAAVRAIIDADNPITEAEHRVRAGLADRRHSTVA